MIAAATPVTLDAFDVAIAASLLLVHAILSLVFQLGLARQVLFAALRMVVQLALIGQVLKFLFVTTTSPLWTAVAAAVMILFAGYEVGVRQEHRLSWRWNYGIGTGSPTRRKTCPMRDPRPAWMDIACCSPTATWRPSSTRPAAWPWRACCTAPSASSASASGRPRRSSARAWASERSAARTSRSKPRSRCRRRRAGATG